MPHSVSSDHVPSSIFIHQTFILIRFLNITSFLEEFYINHLLKTRDFGAKAADHVAWRVVVGNDVDFAAS